MNTCHSLNGAPHIIGLEYFTITTPDRSALDTIRSIFYDSVTSERQENKEEDVNKNRILINGPDRIQILIKSNSE
jgi:hypothetical protein